MKYIILFVILMLLSACSEISDSNVPKVTVPPPLGGTASAPIQMPPEENSKDSITPDISPFNNDTETPVIPKDNITIPSEDIPSEENVPPVNTPPEENIPEEALPEENVPEILTEISTHIYDDDENRVSNINLAAETINGTILEPGEVFSFNDTVGKRSPEKGYKEATIMVNGEHAQGSGGGVCQVSTTLYLAALDCGFKIIERHRHEEEVAYAPGGKDCTVNYDNLDFKFENNSDKTIKINVFVDDNKVVAKFLTDFSI